MHRKTPKVLVIRCSSIGDIVLTTPVIRGLYRQLGAEVHYLTKPAYAQLLSENPYISQIHLLKDSLWKLIAALSDEHFDYVIDLHHNLRSFVIKSALRVPSYSFYKMNIEKWLFVRLKFPSLRASHVVDRYWKSVAPLGVEADTQGLDYFLPQDPSLGRAQLPLSFQKSYVVYAIGGKWGTKKLPLKKMIQLCDQINRPIVLIGGKEDQETGTALADFFNTPSSEAYHKGLEALGKKTLIHNSCGSLSLHESAAVIRDADYVFTHDTGMMHIAAAFGREIFSIWGSTVPELGMYPYRTRFTILEHRGLKCRPCSKIGYRSCPLRHFRCMNEHPLQFSLPEAQ